MLAALITLESLHLLLHHGLHLAGLVVPLADAPVDVPAELRAAPDSGGEGGGGGEVRGC